MMLSERGQKYLNSLTRDSDWTTEKVITEKYFSDNKFKDFDTLVEFQVKYSGYTLTKKNKPGDSFAARLLSRKDIELDKELEYLELGNKFLFDCGDHKTAQFNFYLTHTGQLCTINNEDKINVISESFEGEVERYALHDQISDWVENSHFYELNDSAKFKVLTADFNKIEECSDHYCSWWTKGKIIIVKGTWLDRPEFYIHVYGQNDHELKDFIEKIKDEQIIKIAGG